MRRILLAVILVVTSALGLLFFHAVSNGPNTLGAHPAPAQVCDGANIPCG